MQQSRLDFISEAYLIVLGDTAVLPILIEMLGHPSFQSQYVQRGDVFVREDLVLPQMEQ